MTLNPRKPIRLPAAALQTDAGHIYNSWFVDLGNAAFNGEDVTLTDVFDPQFWSLLPAGKLHANDLIRVKGKGFDLMLTVKDKSGAGVILGLFNYIAPGSELHDLLERLTTIGPAKMRQAALDEEIAGMNEVRA